MNGQPLTDKTLNKKSGKKRYGVVGITKKENAQLGLLLKYIFTNDEVYNSLPQDVLQFPDDLNKLAARYANAV